MLLDAMGLEFRLVAPEEVIPGSFWGEREAGLIGSSLYARLDTPLHSVLHEGAHFICMTPERRAGLDTDAGGDDAEENAVCYLQIVLARILPTSAGNGCAATWMNGAIPFAWAAPRAGSREDADDARDWLIDHGLLDARRSSSPMPAR